MDKNTGNTLQTSTISGRTHIRKDHDFNMECYFDNFTENVATACADTKFDATLY